jgi:murein DD-endopeptidase MepM/ murein hydrolase activator NlpD
MRLLIVAVTALLMPSPMIAESRLDLALPTDNDALFRGGGPQFYQYVERNYKGVISMPWEGGQYGFVRDPLETKEGVIYTRFHEGIDIRALRRDSSGEPLDAVRAIADGKVVHTNLVPGYSNYGKYIVIEHHWDGSNYYSLYGHLSSILVKPAQSVRKNDQIAVMGYTGAGLNRERAHLHLELNLILSHQFEGWHAAFIKNDPNHNGIYNGINLTGIDIAGLYLALRRDPSLTVPAFLHDEEFYYRVAVPKSRHFELVKNYPWMLQSAAGAKTSSWEVFFARSGLPLRVEPSDRKVAEPELTYVKNSAIQYDYLTRGVIGGWAGHAHFTESGAQLMKLLTFPD